MFLSLVEQNRSYRRFHQQKRISEAELKELISLARLSPSAANLQNIRYYLVTDDEDCESMFPYLKWANYLRYWEGPEQGERPAAYIIMLTPKATTRFHHIDTGIAAQTILLGATEKGMGGCMIASADKAAISKLLNLPEAMEINLVIALGYPAEKVVIDEIDDPDDVEYWRDDDGIHHVPKRRLKELILN